MKVQHPIQHILASFWAFLPADGSLRVGRAGDFEYVCGEYAARRQVFAEYYRALAARGNELFPHFVFARSRETVEGILDFTSEWGPLRPNTSGEPLLRTAFGSGASPENYFAFYTDDWRANRRRFAEAVRLVEADDIKALRRLLPYQHQSENPVRTAALYPYFEAGTAIEVLERLWTGDGRMTTAGVRRTAERCGIFFTEKGGPKHRLVLEAVSLADAFWHMLLMDLTERKPMVRACANAKCRTPFLADRSDQKYCGPDCARRVANLAYYHRTGAANRKCERQKKARRNAKSR